MESCMRCSSSAKNVRVLLAALACLALAFLVYCAEPAPAEASNTAGAQAHGTWKTVKGARYYYRADGTPAAGPVLIGKKYWVFSASGRLLTPKRPSVVEVGSRRYYVGRKGHPAKTGWCIVKGRLYHVSKSGRCAAGRTIQGIRFTSRGYAKSNTASKLKMAVMRKIRQLTKSKNKAKILRAAWNWVYSREYVSVGEPEVGKPGWAQRAALRMLERGRGECFSVACTMAAFGYELGYIPKIKGQRWYHAYVTIGGKRWDGGGVKIRKPTYWRFTSWANTTPRATGKYAHAPKVGDAVLNYDGWTSVRGKRYYCVGGKKVRGRWMTIKGRRYHFSSRGVAATYSRKVGGSWYVFDGKGRLLRGTSTRVVRLRGVKYRVAGSGKAKPGWARGGTRLYLKTGALATGTRVIGGELWAFGGGGRYRPARTRELRAAAVRDTDPARLLELLGDPKRTVSSQRSCYHSANVESGGSDITYYFDHVLVSVYVEPGSGKQYLESVVAR